MGILLLFLKKGWGSAPPHHRIEVIAIVIAITFCDAEMITFPHLVIIFDHPRCI